MRGHFKTLLALAASAAVMTGASVAAAQPAPPPAAANRPIDAEQLALAKQLMSLTLGQMNFGQIMKSMDAAMLETVRKENPKVDPAVFERVQAATDKTMSEIMPDLMDDIAAVYARHLTRQEMQDTIAFYSSPSGQAVLHNLPEVMQSLGPLMTKYVPRLQLSVLEALCAENSCNAEQRAALAHLRAQAAGAKP